MRLYLPCLLVLLACSKSNPNSSAGGGSAAPSAATDHAANQPTGPAGTVCERHLLTAADVGGILDEPITGTKPLEHDAQTCYFITATNAGGGPELRVTLRPANGKATIKSWLSGQMGADATPVPGVGDSAVWVADLKKIVAEKNDVLCEVALGGSAVLAKATPELMTKLGALCTKIFAAH